MTVANRKKMAVYMIAKYRPRSVSIVVYMTDTMSAARPDIATIDACNCVGKITSAISAIHA